MDERQQLEQAIAAQESLRGTLDDAVIDATISLIKEKLAALDPSTQQQRKLATILFTDIVGSTRLTKGMDPEEQMALIDPLVQRLAARVTEHGGHVSRFQGDGFKAVFGLPVAHENDPAQAIQAGLAIQAEAARIAEELVAQRGLPNFQVRVGITTGLVFSGGETEGEDTIKGEPVNLAARLESAAQPGTVLISYDCFKHVRGIFDFEPLEPIEAKGFSEPVAVYRVLRAKQRSFYRGMRGVEGVETQMVGREIEFRQLQKALMDVVELGEMKMRTVVGEAGLGKSRMLYEFENWVDLLPEPVWLLYKGRARLETQGIPYGLLRDLFANQFDIRDNDSAQSVRDKLMAGFGEEFGEDAGGEKKIHFIGHLLGYDFPDSPHLADFLEHPELLREQAIFYLTQYFHHLGAHNPVLIILEDLHWADEASLDTFNLLASDLLDHPVMVIATARHRLLERRPHWGEGREFHRRILLEPLSKRESRNLLFEVLQRVENIPDSLSELVVSNAEGNPFYIEELIKMLVEDGVIVRENPHWRVEAGRLEEVHVPSTLTGVLQARLDGLPPEERKILQSASVIGRVFWDRILDYINGSLEDSITDRKIMDVLDELRSRELVFRRETSAFAEAREHIFKHALLRDVTYESVLLRVRQAYHALVADWLIEHTGDRAGEFTGMIADHLELAGRNAQARQYLLEAGKQAAGKYANEEAIRYFTRALTLTAETDLEGRFEMLLERVKIYDLVGSREAEETDIITLETLAEEMGDRAKLAEALLQEARFAIAIGNYPRGLEAAKRAVSLAQEARDEELEAAGHYEWARVHFYQDDQKKMLEQVNITHELARKLDAYELVHDALRGLGNITAEQHEYERSIQYLQESLALSRKLGDRIRESMTLQNLGAIYNHQFKIEQALSCFQAGLALSRETGNKQWEGVQIGIIGFTYMVIGMYPKAQSALEQAMAIHRQIKDQRWIGYAAGGLGDIACFIDHDYPKAANYFTEGLSAARNLGDLGWESEALWLLASAQIGLGNWAEAERLIKESAEALQKMDMQRFLKFRWGSLAEIYMAKGMPDLAVGQIDLILEDRETNEIDAENINLEFRLLYICCQVLLACDDPRVNQVIESTFTQLQAYAAKIQNVDFRESFLNNVPWNKGIIELWKAEQEKEKGSQS